MIPTKLWLIKTDSSGKMIWERRYGSDKGAFGISVQQTRDHGYIVSGGDSEKFYLLKIDSLGNVEWEKTFKGNYENSNIAMQVQQTQDGGYAFVGRSTGRLPSDSPDLPEKSDIHLFKTDSSGNVQWQKKFNKRYDHPKFMQQTRDGGYIIAGNTCDSWQSKDHDIWIIKTNSKGKIMWEKMMGGDYKDRIHCIQQTADGGYVFTGFYGKSEGWRGRVLYLVRFKPEVSEKDNSPKAKKFQPNVTPRHGKPRASGA